MLFILVENVSTLIHQCYSLDLDLSPSVIIFVSSKKSKKGKKKKKKDYGDSDEEEFNPEVSSHPPQ